MDLPAGGFEYDGGQTISEVDKEEIITAVNAALDDGIQAFVVCGVFSPVNNAQEEHAGDIIQEAANNYKGGMAVARSLHSQELLFDDCFCRALIYCKHGPAWIRVWQTRNPMPLSMSIAGLADIMKIV